MDQNTLVSGGQALVKAMDETGFHPRIAMWVHNTDVDTWKLWLVPPAGHADKSDFYRRIAEIVTKHRTELSGIDASDTEMVPATHPAMQGISKFIRAPGLLNIHFAGNRFNGFYLPEGIILRSEAL
ncbi:MAG TPA: hypothetical protein VMD53_12690 [Rhizomicrobium sp.]|nr:hypothetical protein [Rhizomicrobium sp.]